MRSQFTPMQRGGDNKLRCRSIDNLIQIYEAEILNQSTQLSISYDGRTGKNPEVIEMHFLKFFPKK